MHEAWTERFLSLRPSPATRRLYASDLRDLVGFVGRRFGLTLPGFTEEHAIAWRGHLEARGLAPATIARKLIGARGLFAFLLDLEPPPPELAPRNPFRRVRPPRFDRSVGKTPCPGPAEVRRLLAIIPAKTPTGRRDLVITILLFNQGLRLSEVARLERTHILRHGRQTYLALVGKGGSEIRSVLGGKVAVLLNEHLQGLPAGQRYLFTRLDGRNRHGVSTSPDRPLDPTTIRTKLKAYAALGGLDPALFRPHSGRVFFITQSYLATRDLERVARAVGHRELATTRRYLRLGTALEDHPARLLDILPQRRPGARPHTR